MSSAISSVHCLLRLSKDNETLWTIPPSPFLSPCSILRDTSPNGVPGGRHPTPSTYADATLPFCFMQRARWDMCHYFRATIFLVTNGTCDVPLLERAGEIIHVAFVFVKTLTKRCFPTWRPFNLHSRRLVWDNLVFSTTAFSLLLPRVALSRMLKVSVLLLVILFLSWIQRQIHLYAYTKHTLCWSKNVKL